MCHHITPQVGENGVKKRGKTAGKGEKTKDGKGKGGTGRTDKGMAVHAAARKSWERAAFVPLDVSFCDRKRNSVYGNNRMA